MTLIEFYRKYLFCPICDNKTTLFLSIEAKNPIYNLWFRLKCFDWFVDNHQLSFFYDSRTIEEFIGWAKSYQDMESHYVKRGMPTIKESMLPKIDIINTGGYFDSQLFSNNYEAGVKICGINVFCMKNVSCWSGCMPINPHYSVDSHIIDLESKIILTGHDFNIDVIIPRFEWWINYPVRTARMYDINGNELGNYIDDLTGKNFPMKNVHDIYNNSKPQLSPHLPAKVLKKFGNMGSQDDVKEYLDKYRVLL